MIRAALIGLGKMGMSHLAILNTHPDVKLVAVCDSTAYILDVLTKYTGIRGYSDYRTLLHKEKLDAVVIATPSRFHAEMVRTALDQNLNVYCEKPFCLDVSEGLALAEHADRKGLVSQVGYHYRSVATFQEVKRLLDARAIGKIHHFRAEAHGPVVLRPTGSTWRSSKRDGGGCLYDYASHAIDLVNYLVGRPDSVGGTVLNQVFSRDVEDEVYSTFYYADGKSGQLAANWSDESCRKMSVKVTIWGANGSILADRQEIQVYLREPVRGMPELVPGWNVRNTTELTKPVWFYLRGEEYSIQIDHFIQSVKQRDPHTVCTFRNAVDADLVAAMMQKDVHRTVPSLASPRPNGKRQQPRGSAVQVLRSLLR